MRSWSSFRAHKRTWSKAVITLPLSSKKQVPRRRQPNSVRDLKQTPSLDLKQSLPPDLKQILPPRHGFHSERPMGKETGE